MKFYSLLLFVLLAPLIAHAEPGAPPKICMILDKGGKDDHSFNESAVKGFEKALKDLKIDKTSKFVEPKTDSQIPQFINAFVKNVNCSLIISIGFNPSSYIIEHANKNPNTKFLAVDVDVTEKVKSNNVKSIVFDEHEGSFIVGYIAALESKTTKIGFIGGMDIPIIHRFQMGYETGAKFFNKKTEVVSAYVGITPDSWNNPTKAKELAFSMYKSGIDVIFQVAAASGQGVFDAADVLNKESKNQKTHHAIGVDSNQNGINPDVIITSMVKKVDSAVYNSVKDFVGGTFKTGKETYGLENNGVEWALDEYNKKFYTNNDLEKISGVIKDIISKKIIVPDYYKQK